MSSVLGRDATFPKVVEKLSEPNTSSSGRPLDSAKAALINSSLSDDNFCRFRSIELFLMHYSYDCEHYYHTTKNN